MLNVVAGILALLVQMVNDPAGNPIAHQIHVERIERQAYRASTADRPVDQSLPIDVVHSLNIKAALALVHVGSVSDTYFFGPNGRDALPKQI